MQYIFFLITMSAEVGLRYKQSSVQSNTIPPGTMHYNNAFFKLENKIIMHSSCIIIITTSNTTEKRKKRKIIWWYIAK